jgi:hypothetical protein
MKLLPGELTKIYDRAVMRKGVVLEDADGNKYRFVQSEEADVGGVGVIERGMGLHYKDGDRSQVSLAGGGLNHFAGLCMVDTATYGNVKDNEFFFVLIQGDYAYGSVADGVGAEDPLYSETTNASLTTITDSTAQVPVAFAREANATGDIAEKKVTVLGVGE